MSALRAPRAIVLDAHDAERAHTLQVCERVGIQSQGWASSGSAGLELLESLPQAPELVIIDLYLPDIDGADLIQSLAMLDPGSSLIVCSAAEPRLLDAAYTLAQTLSLRVLAALPKPLQPDALRRALALMAPARAAAPRPSLPALQPGQVQHALRARQFLLHYQPKVALRDMSLQGVEALVRWQHPVHGLLGPCSFLPQLREAGLMHALTLEVLDLALADWRRWDADGLALPLSLNLSAGLLGEAHLASQLVDMVRAAQIAPRFLTFEVTEDTELADLGAALRVLIKLRLAGFGLSLDDYGVGFSSMLRLSRIPFTELKIDRSLVHNAWARPHLLPLLRNAIGLARDLGITAVAEGVETVQDLQLLQRLGCQQAQGYYLGRPMPASALHLWRTQ